MTWRLDRIVTAFSESATDPSRWNTAMDVVAAETASFGAILVPLQGKIAPAPISESMQPCWDQYMREGWSERDARYGAARTIMSNGIASDFDAKSETEMRRDPFYQELLTRYKLQWSALLRVSADDEHWCLAIQRTLEQGPVETDDLARMRGLIAPISAAATYARALGFARSEGALAAFEMSQTAAAMLNVAGEVIKTNRQFDKLLGLDIMISNRRLRSRDRDSSNALDRAAFSVLMRDDIPAVPAIPLPREFGRNLIANVVRADRISREVLSPARAFILLSDPDRNLVPALDDLAGVFGLTRSESRVAVELQGGLSVADAAAKLGTTYESTRTTLKQVFRKTGASSQADLVRLLSRFRSTSE